MPRPLRFDIAPPAELPEFHWSHPEEPYLLRLLGVYALDELVAGARSPYERLRRACRWTHRRWVHHGSRRPALADPISILEEAASGGRFRCVEFSIVLAAVLTALGIPARRLALRTRDAATRAAGAGHVVVEAYLREAGQWVMADAQAGVIPFLRDEALSALALQRALVEMPAAVRADCGEGPSTSLTSYFRFLAPYLFYFDVPFDNRIGADPEAGHLILHPHGSEPLRAFQRRTLIGPACYTHSVSGFYSAPQPAAAPGGG